MLIFAWNTYRLVQLEIGDCFSEFKNDSTILTQLSHQITGN